jgi:hypothetical protein
MGYDLGFGIRDPKKTYSGSRIQTLSEDPLFLPNRIQIGLGFS